MRYNPEYVLFEGTLLGPLKGTLGGPFSDKMGPLGDPFSFKRGPLSKTPSKSAKYINN